MRLLHRSDTGEFSLTRFRDEAIPPYAILSHTWGADTEEVTFDDLMNGTGKDKPGYEKIRFCGEQAAVDDLEYFWIDTCCINKANKAELSQAINSMFCWYRNATRCYVYLSDVSTAERKSSDRLTEFTWEPAFQVSRWFTRGWTLQELLAPNSVEFFSREGERLGDKNSLRRQICEITVIPELALQGAPLFAFPVNERFSWMQPRETKREEDKVYSLLGIFGVYVPPVYGEGTASAFKRLREEIGKLEQCMQDLHLTNPRDDKKRIEDTKGGLLKDSYRWILGNADFQRWRDDQQSRLLWIKGDPGKGKTMLLCGIVDELSKSMAKTDLLSYFFCQATDSRINNATAVLRGLLYLLANQQPSLVSHIRKKHDHAGKALFEDANAWVALSEIFTNMLEDSNMNNTYLIIDALDECVTPDLPILLDFIVQKSATSSRVKWIVSSRNWPNVEEKLERARHKVRISLELNARSISTAVSVFIQHKVRQLAEQKQYSDKIQKALLDHLSSNAHDTFLWVALVCQNLESVSKWNVIKKLDAFPPSLDLLYERMMQQISDSNDVDRCMQILALAAIVYRPTTLTELVTLAQQLEDVADDPESVREIIGHCGSFLTLRENIVYFVHQSAKDFLSTKVSQKIFPFRREEVHWTVFSRSLQAMSTTLHRDMYGLKELGYLAEQIRQPDPDPLAALRYSCIYWVDHLCASGVSSMASGLASLQDGGVVHVFLRTKYIYLLEALSLCQSMSEGVISMTKLVALVQGRVGASLLNEVVQDAYRFIMYHKVAIENAPLQAYASALLFSPVRSLVRALFQKEAPEWITITPPVAGDWSACLQTLEGHRSVVSSVAFSPDSQRLASASGDKTVKIWDPSSGDCLKTLKGHSYEVWSVAFSPDSQWLASASPDMTVKIWDPSSGDCLQTLEGNSRWVISVAFSPDSQRLASASDKTVKIWNISSGNCLQTLEGHGDGVSSVAFSPDSQQLASVSHDMTVKIWDVSSGNCLKTLEGHSSGVSSVAFSPDSQWLASASRDMTVKVWDPSSGDCLQTLEGHSDRVSSVTFSPDSQWLASTSRDTTVKIWDPSSDKCLQTFEGHSDEVWSVAFSPDSQRLASASDTTVKIWDVRSGDCLKTLEGHSDEVLSVAFSPDSQRLASASHDMTVKIWDPSSDDCVQTLEGHSNEIISIAFSPDSQWLVSASRDMTVKIWDPSSGDCLKTLKGHSYEVWSVAFSPDSQRLASASDNTLKIWNPSSGDCLKTLKGHSDGVSSVTFSPDSQWLASASRDEAVKIWDVSSGECLQTLKGHSSWVMSVAFSSESLWLASASVDMTVRIWDVSNGNCLQTLKGHRDGVYSVAFSPNSQRLASASHDMTVKIWDPSSDDCVQTLEGHSNEIISIAFSPDSLWLASASDDMTVKIWDVSSGKCLETLDIGRPLYDISFDATVSCLHTETGTIVVSASALSNDAKAAAIVTEPQYKNAALSPDRTWITYNSKRLVWLPSEYRSSCSAVSGKMIAIGVGSGKVWTCNLGRHEP